MCTRLLWYLLLSAGSQQQFLYRAAKLQVRAELFDWTSHVCHGDYDVALACDVLYEHFSVEPVANIAPQLLNPKTGKLLLADPLRRTRDNRYEMQLKYCHWHCE